MTVARGCGASRTAGGLYLVTGLSKYGRPLEDFLLCPPILLEPELGLTSRGVQMKQRPNGVWDVYDVVGAEYYPNVYDFIEEVRQLGMSRRAEGIPHAKLTRESRLLLAHPRAYIENWEKYVDDAHECPIKMPEHAPHRIEEMCLGLCRSNVEQGQPIEVGVPSPRRVMRTMPSFQYLARSRPDGVTPQYHHAFFMSLPIQRIEVVQAADGGHRETLKKLEDCTIPVIEVEE